MGLEWSYAWLKPMAELKALLRLGRVEWRREWVEEWRNER